MTERDQHPDSPPRAASEKPDDIERAIDNADAAQRGEVTNQDEDAQ